MYTDWTNKVKLEIHCMNTEPLGYEHSKKLKLRNLTSYLMKKYIQSTNIQLTHFKVNVIFVSWDSSV
jgi:hypothetical protein